MHWIRLLVIGSIFMFSTGESDISAQRTAFEVQSLNGLNGIRVLIEPINPELYADGLTETMIRSDTEQKLRQAGIKVLTEEEFLKEPGFPHLYIFLNSVRDPNTGLYAVNILVQVRQAVLLARDAAIAVESASTWETGTTSLIGTPSVESWPREAIRECIDEFIADYYAVNPRRG